VSRPRKPSASQAALVRVLDTFMFQPKAAESATAGKNDRQSFPVIAVLHPHGGEA